MLHLRRWITFGVNVADLFQLQGSLECRWEVVVTTQVQEVVALLVFGSDLSNAIVLFECLFDLVWNFANRFDHFATLVVAHVT